MAKANLVRMLVTLFFLGGSVASIYNVYSDNTELRKQASVLGCGAEGCFKMLGEQRSPLNQTFTFQVEGNRAETRTVHCARAGFLVGDYKCETAP